MVKILLLGATGYVGGEVLYQLTNESPIHYDITCLIRDELKAAQVSVSYPDARLIIAGLDDIKILQREVQIADVVLSLASTSHSVSVLAIAEALKIRRVEKASPAIWIQISGGLLYAAEESAQRRFGISSEKTYDDLRDVAEIVSIIKSTPTRISEQIVVAQSPDIVKTALIVGPHIYGAGRGPCNKRTVQGPEIARAMLRLGHGFKLGDGNNVWSDVHVADLAELIRSLIQAAQDGKNGIWNQEGIYNPENGKMSFGDLCSFIAQELKSEGFFETTDLKAITADEADGMSIKAAVLWGTNSIMKSTRARERLGWAPSRASLADEVPSMVLNEVNRLGLVA